MSESSSVLSTRKCSLTSSSVSGCTAGGVMRRIDMLSPVGGAAQWCRAWPANGGLLRSAMHPELRRALRWESRQRAARHCRAEIAAAVEIRRDKHALIDAHGERRIAGHRARGKLDRRNGGRIASKPALSAKRGGDEHARISEDRAVGDTADGGEPCHPLQGRNRESAGAIERGRDELADQSVGRE